MCLKINNDYWFDAILKQRQRSYKYVFIENEVW